jgi:UDP-GlcNAc3NAcA epimerase
MQKEAYFFSVPCITLRPKAEWLETVEVGWNILAGSDGGRIRSVIKQFHPPIPHPNLYGDGESAAKIVGYLCH